MSRMSQFFMETQPAEVQAELRNEPEYKQAFQMMDALDELMEKIYGKAEKPAPF